MLSRARGHKFLTFRGTKKARQTSWRRLPCLGKEKKRQHAEVRVKIASSKPKSEDNLTKTKVNMGQQHGQVNSGSLSGVQSLPPGCELKKRNVRCQQKNTRRRIEWVDTPSKEKKKQKQTCPTAFRNLIRQFLPLNHLTRTVTSLLFLHQLIGKFTQGHQSANVTWPGGCLDMKEMQHLKTLLNMNLKRKKKSKDVIAF